MALLKADILFFEKKPTADTESLDPAVMDRLFTRLLDLVSLLDCSRSRRRASVAPTVFDIVVATCKTDEEAAMFAAHLAPETRARLLDEVFFVAPPAPDPDGPDRYMMEIDCHRVQVLRGFHEALTRPA
jgi:hypothetical protein